MENNDLLSHRYMVKLDEIISELQCVLCDIYSNYELSPPRSRLWLNQNKRWVLDGTDLTCGDCIEVYHCGEWRKTSIEHDGKKYYLTDSRLSIRSGLQARRIIN